MLDVGKAVSVVHVNKHVIWYEYTLSRDWGCTCFAHSRVADGVLGIDIGQKILLEIYTVNRTQRLRSSVAYALFTRHL